MRPAGLGSVPPSCTRWCRPLWGGPDHPGPLRLLYRDVSARPAASPQPHHPDRRGGGPVVVRLPARGAVHVLRQLFSPVVCDSAHLAGAALCGGLLRRHGRAAARRTALAPARLLWPLDGGGADSAALTTDATRLAWEGRPHSRHVSVRSRGCLAVSRADCWCRFATSVRGT